MGQLETRIENLQGDDGVGFGRSKNVANQSACAHKSPLHFATRVIIGQIIRNYPGASCARVSCDKYNSIVCVYASGNMPAATEFPGVREAAMYPEGTLAVVLVRRDGPSIIIGAYPEITYGDLFMTDGSNPIFQIQSEPGVSKFTDAAYESDPVTAHGGRPIDVLPGEHAFINENNLAIALFKLHTLIRATERAKLEMFLLDDLVRLTSAQFQHRHAIGAENIFSDYGYGTLEMEGSPHQCEMMGMSGYKPSMSVDTIDRTKGTNTDLKLDAPEAYPRVRHRLQLGWLAGALQYTLMQPDPDKDGPIAIADQGTPRGVAQIRVDSSGLISLNSTTGVFMRKVVSIAVPTKKKEPWVPPITDPKPATKLAYAWPTDAGVVDGQDLLTRDALALSDKHAVQRHMEQPDNWVTPVSDKAVEPPQQSVETIDGTVLAESTTASQAVKKKAEAFIGLDEMGRVVMRSAWGTEMVLGEDLRITCPRRIEIRSGDSVVIMGGRDVIVKAVQSVDVSATRNDVRIKGEKNLQIVSTQGGILIESQAVGDTQDFENPGQETVSKGVVIKAKSSRVFIWGNTVHISFISRCFIEAFKQARGALLQFLAPTIYGIGEYLALITKTAGLQVGSGAQLTGNTVNVAGQTSVGIFEGAKVHVPFTKATSPNLYSLITKETKKLYTANWGEGDADSVLGESYMEDARDLIKFTYRSSDEYGTKTVTDVFGDRKFMLVESWWAFVTTDGVDKWVERPLDERYPWPGADCYKGSSLLALKSEANYAKPFKDRKEKPGEIEPRSLDDLTIRSMT